MKIQYIIIYGIVLLALLSGCARLPDYALPRSSAPVNDPATLSEAVTYRQLTRSDFKASTLPEERAMHADSIHAYTCARIRPTQDSKFAVTRARFGRSWAFFGSIRTIAFEAVMFPGCSWWNPAMPAQMHRYVLQHEQIHFAIVELTARRLTADARLKARSFMAIQPTSKAVREEMTTTVNKWIQAAMAESLAMHTDFDEDTSMYPSPRWQQLWREKIETQLAEPQPQAPAKERNGRP